MGCVIIVTRRETFFLHKKNTQQHSPDKKKRYPKTINRHYKFDSGPCNIVIVVLVISCNICDYDVTITQHGYH